MSLLEDAPSRCLKVFVAKTMQNAFFAKVTELCRASGIPYYAVEARALDEMLDGESHQGVAASVAQAPMIALADAEGLLPAAPAPIMAVVADHVQDPRNLGAMIRSAEAAGAAFVALPARRGALPTGTVAKTSAGASLRLPLASAGNVANAVRELQKAGLWAIGLDESARATIYDSPIPARCLFVVGSEGEGISRTAAAACDETLRIPADCGPGSLNASVALSVAMFEWLRLNRMSYLRSENA
jgi:23S rRNA (guanosine2251-2'-O)-methyltransferase